MRAFLLFIGWSSVLGSFADGALWLYALSIVANADWSNLAISVDIFLKQYLEILYWVKQVAYYIMPNGFVSWLFGLPALAYFPARILLSMVIGWWALKKAAQLAQQHEQRV